MIATIGFTVGVSEITSSPLIIRQVGLTAKEEGNASSSANVVVPFFIVTFCDLKAIP